MIMKKSLIQMQATNKDNSESNQKILRKIIKDLKVNLKKKKEN